MKSFSTHSFHIPVMGLGFTVDTPLKVARFGITSAISVVEDTLLESLRAYFCSTHGMKYWPIADKHPNRRARRIALYLDTMHDLLENQFIKIRHQPFRPGSELVRYFEMLPDYSTLKQRYREMCASCGEQQIKMQDQLREDYVAGGVEVNIMTKPDRMNYAAGGEELDATFSDASAALRGVAESKMNLGVIFSAGLNPRLYQYISEFGDFFPTAKGKLRKKVVLKVSDYRSALIQGKYLAKKGIWVSEYRIESGLNCGGHAFPTDGQLLGPILEQFKENRDALKAEVFDICQQALETAGRPKFPEIPEMRVSVQGGIGSAEEHEFLLNHYEVDSTGWGSPFLLVPEATNVDDDTLKKLAEARRDDFYLSNASPLGVRFHNFKKSSSNQQRIERIEAGRPGSPCFKKYLATNTEFTKKPICTASRKYQALKVKQLRETIDNDQEFEQARDEVFEKECLCEGLGTTALLTKGINPVTKLKAVSICPGPNLAFFSDTFTLEQMVGHIYGKHDLLNAVQRPHMFVNELKIYMDYFSDTLEPTTDDATNTKGNVQKAIKFANNLVSSTEYYQGLFAHFLRSSVDESVKKTIRELTNMHAILQGKLNAMAQ